MTAHPHNTISPDAAARDRLLMAFFRCTRSGPPEFLQSYFFEPQSSHKQFFEVIVRDGDSDYDEVCTRLAPDLCVFESGTYAGERSIVDTSSHPEILILEFLKVDAVDASRVVFIADMAQWDVRWLFTASISLAGFTPGIADRLFLWPNSIDPQNFRGYEQVENVPVLLTGSHTRHHPCRVSANRALTPEFITMTMPRFEWNSEASPARVVEGADHTRLPGANLFVPTCGAVTNEVVRKPLEIPASGACLVTEKTASIETFCFVDMVNWTSATSGGVVQKRDTLLEDFENFGRITAAGHDIVHRHHFVHKRSQALQWLRLISEFGQDILIGQSWPDGEFSLARGAAGVVRVVSGGLDQALVAARWSACDRNDARAAEVDFLRPIDFYFIPEGGLRIIHCYLELDDVRAARGWHSQLLLTPTIHHHAFEPDPAQCAHEIRVLLCKGDGSRAVAAAQRYPDPGNSEFDRMRTAVTVIIGMVIFRNEDALRPAATCPGPEPDEASWTSLPDAILQVCGERASADRLAGSASLSIGTAALHRGKCRMDVRLSRVRSGDAISAAEPWLRAGLSPLNSRVTADDWSQCLEDLVQAEPLNQAFLIAGGQFGSRSARRIRRGLAENPQRPSVETVDVGASSEITPGTGIPGLVTAAGSQTVNNVHSQDAASVTILAGPYETAGHRILESLMTNRDDSVIAVVATRDQVTRSCDVMTVGSRSERHYSFHPLGDEGYLPMTDTRTIPLMDLTLQHAQISEEMHQDLDRVTAAGGLVLRPEGEKFPREFAACSGVSDVAGVGNGTDALQLPLRAHDTCPGHEVTIPANTFVATAEPGNHAGAIAHLVECDENFLTDAYAVCGKIIERTPAAIGAHLRGQTARIELLRAAEGDDILIVEDAAQSQGPRRSGMCSGGLGDLAGVSFDPDQDLGAHGDGGGKLTNCAEDAECVREQRNHGGTHRYSHPVPGANPCVVLSAKLARLDRWKDERGAASFYYDELLAQHADVIVIVIVIVIVPKVIEGEEHVFYPYLIRTARRGTLVGSMNAEGVNASIHCSLSGAPYSCVRRPRVGRRILSSGRDARVEDHVTADLPRHYEGAARSRCRHSCEDAGRFSTQPARLAAVTEDQWL